jgi:hypothetical protein
LLHERWANEALLPEAWCGSQELAQQFSSSANYEDWWAPCEYLSVPEAYQMPILEPCRRFRGCFSMEQAMHNNAGEESVTAETRTTVMLRDLPEDYTRASLLKLLATQGFFGRFDFVYLPIDFKHQKNLGYALVNLVSASEALRFTAHFENFPISGVSSGQNFSVRWCSPQQGLEAHVQRYRNSPVMHESVPEEWRPLLFSHGVQVAFPSPTQKIKAPKVKGRQAVAA